MIASSTGSGSKKVLVSDEKQSCPPGSENDSSICKAVRVPVSESDSVVSLAFKAQSDRQFPMAEPVPVDNMDGTVYATQTISFSELGGEITLNGIHWRILILIPVEAQADDTIVPGESQYFALILVPVILGAVSCSIFLGLLMKFRNERDMMLSDWRFTGLCK